MFLGNLYDKIKTLLESAIDTDDYLIYAQAGK
jgi:hypothetical protein